MLYRLLLLIIFISTSYAQNFYRVYLKDNIKVDSLSDYKVLAKSEWMNTITIETKHSVSEIIKIDGVENVEVLFPQKNKSIQSNKLQANKNQIENYRKWQLDTLSYSYFKSKSITGKGVLIAIIDAGFTGTNKSSAFEHLFQQNHIKNCYDFIDRDTNVFHGSYHGSMVWACIAGIKDGKQSGLAINADFLLLRTEDEKKETVADEDRWVEAIEYAYKKGARIVNSSVGFSNALHKLDELNGSSFISKAAQIATEKGMIIVQANGNEFITLWKTVIVPSDAEGVVSVGSIDKKGNQTYFSSVGPTYDYRIKPDIVAPGICVSVKDNNWVMVAGSSFSAPLVTGFIACMLELNPNYTADSIKQNASLYPYKDPVYGCGVPSIHNNTKESFSSDIVLKDQYLILEPKLIGKEVILKIINDKGVIRYCNKFKVTSTKVKLRQIKKSRPFNYNFILKDKEVLKISYWIERIFYEYNLH